MDIIGDEELDVFIKPARFLIAGLSGSGKSYFTSKLLRKYRNRFNKIIVIGSDLENVDDLEVERDDTFNPLREELSGNTLVIFDDVIFQPNLVKIASEIFARGRHKNISAIFLTQNLFMNDKSFRILSLNASHVILFRIRDINQIKYLGKSFLDDTQISNFVELYKKIVLQRTYGYILIDFTKSIVSHLKIRSDVLNEDLYERVYTL